MSQIEQIVHMLKANPGMVYINPEGTTLFALVGPEEKLMCIMPKGKTFNEMTDAEINETVVSALK